MRATIDSSDLPPPRQGLAELARNLWWSWNRPAESLWQQIDSDLWAETRRNPIKLLRALPQRHLESQYVNPGFLALYERVMTEYREYMRKTEDSVSSTDERGEIAYLCMEFGLAGSLPFYAGGLGILAGDHLKAASDLDLPMVGIGLLYWQGAGSQRITESGGQEIEFADLAIEDLPIDLLLDGNGKPIVVPVALGNRQVHLRVWRISVGRVALFLLDSNVPANGPADRELTARLYPNDPETRLAQEIILGAGGVLAIEAFGHRPMVWHMNEGHSAMMLLQRGLHLMDYGLSLDAALEELRSTSVFTTHTPVPAGHEQFPVDYVENLLLQYREIRPELVRRFLEMAIESEEVFSMSTLAMRLSRSRNAVSAVHGQVARQMWNRLWPNEPVEGVPIIHVTNGVHLETWLAPEIARLLDQHLEPDWRNHPELESTWEGVRAIPDQLLWDAHRVLKGRLAQYVDAHAEAAGNLDPEALVIGFARRFVTYKRADLLFRYPKRLAALLSDPDRPIQILIAGRAHPGDIAGKQLLTAVIEFTKRPELAGRVHFLPGYDLDIARHLVQGVDLWLNTPRAPNEASGTSGQKAAINGVLNCSILDGWWAEAYHPSAGWAIGDGSQVEGVEAQDESDARQLLDVLDSKIVPTYFKAGEYPKAWVDRMKESISRYAPAFSARRMLKEYAEDLYYASESARSS